MLRSAKRLAALGLIVIFASKISEQWLLRRYSNLKEFSKVPGVYL